MVRPAYSFVRRFEGEAARELRVDRHYLLCASRGALRLEAEGTVWTLPPARAALITAGHAIEVPPLDERVDASIIPRLKVRLSRR